jgi:hypothetical protein
MRNNPGANTKGGGLQAGKVCPPSKWEIKYLITNIFLKSREKLNAFGRKCQ